MFTLCASCRSFERQDEPHRRASFKPSDPTHACRRRTACCTDGSLNGRCSVEKTPRQAPRAGSPRAGRNRSRAVGRSTRSPARGPVRAPPSRSSGKQRPRRGFVGHQRLAAYVQHRGPDRRGALVSAGGQHIWPARASGNSKACWRLSRRPALSPDALYRGPGARLGALKILAQRGLLTFALLLASL